MITNSLALIESDYMSDVQQSQAAGFATEVGQPGGRELQLVTFHLGAEEFACDIAQVQEIIRMQPLTRVPNSPIFVQGVINLRGRVIPTLSLRKRFDLEERPPGKETRIVIVEADKSVLGLIVDQVSEVVRLGLESIEAPPRLRQAKQEYVTGVARVGERLLIVLDINRLVLDDDRGTLPQPEPQHEQPAAGDS